MALTHTTWEMMWPIPLEGFLSSLPLYLTVVNMHYHNQFSIYTINHVEVDYHFVQNVVLTKQIHTPFAKFDGQLTDIFSEALGFALFLYFVQQTEMLDIQNLPNFTCIGNIALTKFQICSSDCL